MSQEACPSTRRPSGLGHRLRPHRPGAGSPTRTRSGTSCAQPARSPTPTATAASGCRPATRTCPPSPTTPSNFTSRSVVVTEQPADDRPRRRRPADLLRPAVHHRPARMLLLPAFTPQAIAQARAAHPAHLRRADRRPRRPGRRRRRRRVRPAHPGAGHRQDARASRGGRRPVPRLDSVFLEDTLGRRRRRRAGAREGCRSCSTICRPRSRTTSRQPPRRPHQLPARRPSSTGEPLTDHHVLGTLRCS